MNESIGTKEKQFTMCFFLHSELKNYMLREFIDRNIFYAGHEKIEIKERTLHTAGAREI